MLQGIKNILNSIVKWKNNAVENNFSTVNYEWDTYDIREIKKMTNELKSTLVSIPYFFCYEDEE